MTTEIVPEALTSFSVWRKSQGWRNSTQAPPSRPKASKEIQAQLSVVIS